jgi:hypothetical protein
MEIGIIPVEFVEENSETDGTYADIHDPFTERMRRKSGDSEERR